MPLFAPLPGVQADTRYTNLYNNPFFDYLSEQLPQNIKELFKWCEHVYFNCPPIVNAVKKLVNYPITDFEYQTDSAQIKKATKELLYDILNIKSHLITTGINYYIYGNVFRSIHFPFKRFLKCKKCGSEISIEHADFTIKQFEFILNCPNCLTKGKAELSDKTNSDLSKVQIINWNVRNIELYSNPITGKTTYYYKVDESLRKGILNKELTILEDTPQIFIEAIKANKAVKFNSNLYHLYTNTIDGFAPGWGIPPLATILKHYMYSAIMRKSNEAIALERITPKIILFPNVNTSDPTILATLGDWKTNIDTAIKKWRKDPNYIMLAPYSTGMVNVGSDAKMILMSNELRQVEEDMIRSLDIPVEFIYGTTNLQNSPVALRMLENQLTPYVDQITDYINWIIDRIGAFTDTQYCKVKLTPFKLIDDVMQKQILVSMMGNALSKQTIQEMFSIDTDTEREKIKQEAIEEYKMQKEIQKRQMEVDSNIAAQTEEDSAAQEMDTIAPYNQQKLIAQADQIATQFLNVPYEERRSYLAQLQNEDFVMYALVRARMESMKENLSRQQPQ